MFSPYYSKQQFTFYSTTRNNRLYSASFFVPFHLFKCSSRRVTDEAPVPSLHLGRATGYQDCDVLRTSSCLHTNKILLKSAISHLIQVVKGHHHVSLNAGTFGGVTPSFNNSRFRQSWRNLSTSHYRKWLISRTLCTLVKFFFYPENF
jgi:hypothetical protein